MKGGNHTLHQHFSNPMMQVVEGSNVSRAYISMTDPVRLNALPSRVYFSNNGNADNVSPDYKQLSFSLYFLPFNVYFLLFPFASNIGPWLFSFWLPFKPCHHVGSKCLSISRNTLCIVLSYLYHVLHETFHFVTDVAAVLHHNLVSIVPHTLSPCLIIILVLPAPSAMVLDPRP